MLRAEEDHVLGSQGRLSHICMLLASKESDGVDVLSTKTMPSGTYVRYSFFVKISKLSHIFRQIYTVSASDTGKLNIVLTLY